MNGKKTDGLYRLLSQIEQNIIHKDKVNPSVSVATIGWQLDHALKVIHAVLESLKNSNPEQYKAKFNLTRTVLLNLGWFPRGKVKAPKISRPPDVIVSEDLQLQIQHAKMQLSEIPSLHKHNYFDHFIFGKLTKAQTIRFLETHTNHHLKIVNDILKT